MFKRLTRVLFRDTGLKAVALVIAVLLWNYANARVKGEIDLDVPLEVRVPKEYVKLYQNAPRILLLARGPQELITRLRRRPARMELRLEHAITPADLDETGHATLHVDPRRWKWQNVRDKDLAQLSFKSTRPETVDVYASPRTEKELTVRVQLATGAAPPGYDIVAVPSTVTARGPALLLNRPDMTEISTSQVYLSGLRYGPRYVDLRRSVPLRLQEGLEVNVPLELSQGGVTVQIVPKTERKGGVENPRE